MGLLPNDMDILPASDDRVFKLLLTSPDAEPVLMDLISSIIKRPVVKVFVRNNELPVDDIDEKAERLDVNCNIDDGTQVDLEMQASHIQEDSGGEHKNLKGKSIYYLCDLHSSQSAKGVRRYDKLAQSFQVTFCSYTVFPKRASFINSFSMRHDEDNELLSDAIRVVYLELSKLSSIINKTVNTMTDLEKWAVFFKYANDPTYRETVNEVIESKEVLRVAGNLLMGISQDERERAVFRSRRMYQTDMASDFATAEDRGIEKGINIGRLEGRTEGLAKGRLEGRTEGIIEVARNLLKMSIPIEQILTATQLTQSELESLIIQNNHF